MAILYADTVTAMTTGAAVAGDTIILGGYHAMGDGGGGTFLCISSPGSWTVDNGLLFTNVGSTKYYQRLVNTPYISVKWFGAYGDNFNDDYGPINAAFTATSNGNIIMNDGVDATRTRIYFPAGVYIISRPIAKRVLTSYQPYAVSGLEIVGERAVIKTADADAFGTDYGMWLNPIGSVNIKGITFKAFKRALGFNNNTDDVSNVSLDCVNFQNHSDLAIFYNCNQKSTITIDNSNWSYCNKGLNLSNGDGVIRTSKMQPSGWLADESWFIYCHVYATLTIKNSTCIPPHSPYNAYAFTSAWIGCSGSVRVVNTRFLQPPSPADDNKMGHIIAYIGTGHSWGSWEPQTRVVLKDCYCDCSRSAIRLVGIPNAIICKHNTGFTGREFLLLYDNPTSIDSVLDNMYGLLSIEIDNIPFYGTSNWESNKIYSKSNPNTTFPIPFKDQLKLLPYIRVNAGLDSYGYAEHFTHTSTPSVVKFFMGKQSFDSSDANNSAIYGDYSFEVKLINVTSYDSTSGNYYEGNICAYNSYRVQCKVVGGVTVIEGIYPVGTEDLDPYAPKLTNDSNVLKVGTQGSVRYGIYYQIRSIVPPHVEAFAG